MRSTFASSLGLLLGWASMVLVASSPSSTHTLLPRLLQGQRALKSGKPAAPVSGGTLITYAELTAPLPRPHAAALLHDRPLLAQLPYQFRLFLAGSPFPAPPEADMPDACGRCVTLYGSMGKPYLRREGEAALGVVLRAAPTFGGSRREAFHDLAIRWGPNCWPACCPLGPPAGGTRRAAHAPPPAPSRHCRGGAGETWYGRLIAIFQYSTEDALAARRAAVFVRWFRRCTARPSAAAALTGMLHLEWETTHAGNGEEVHGAAAPARGKAAAPTRQPPPPPPAGVTILFDIRMEEVTRAAADTQVRGAPPALEQQGAISACARERRLSERSSLTTPRAPVATAGRLPRGRRRLSRRLSGQAEEGGRGAAHAARQDLWADPL